LILLHQGGVLLLEADDDLLQIVHLRLFPVASRLGGHPIFQLAPHHFLILRQVRQLLPFPLRRLSVSGADFRRLRSDPGAAADVRRRRIVEIGVINILEKVGVIHLAARAALAGSGHRISRNYISWGKYCARFCAEKQFGAE